MKSRIPSTVLRLASLIPSQFSPLDMLGRRLVVLLAQVGVIENEFGSVAIDEMLLAQAERPAEQVTESARAHSCYPT